MQYRPDIDGLRAVAVLSVILFHIDKRLLPGGFVGVDIFFVISGFLITGNIIREIDQKRFSIVEFYRRRVKRIAPVMLLVIGVTVAVGQILMRPEDARSTAKAAAGSLVSMANVYFWLFQDASYFAPDSAETPLLHLWSLGVEEQFYFGWPLLLTTLYRPGRRKPFVALVALATLASFALGASLFDQAPSFVYYMLPTRAGELLIGAIVALAVLDDFPRRLAPWLARGVALAGGALVLGSFFLIDENQRFPGWLAIPPTLGTALLILAGNCGLKGTTGLLSLRPLVWVGLMSYSAYLWHWPLLAFFRYGYGRASQTAGIIIFLATLLLAWLSYRYVELPARRSEASAARVFASQYILPAGLLLTVCVVLIYPGVLGLTLGSDAYRQRLGQLRRDAQPAFLSEAVCQRQRVLPADTIDPRCVQGPLSIDPPDAILWGDSNAAHYVGMIEVFAKEAGFRFRNLETSACPPIFGDPGPFVTARRDADCRASLATIRPILGDYRVVIISAAWTSYQSGSEAFLQAFFETASELASDHALVIILGKAPIIHGYDGLCREKALRYPLLVCEGTEVPPSADVITVNDRLRQFAKAQARIRYFDANSYLCPRERCRALAATGEPRYLDPHHLTLPGSRALGTEIVAMEGVPPAFLEIARSATEAVR